jgi:hypothetical protein
LRQRKLKNTLFVRLDVLRCYNLLRNVDNMSVRWLKLLASESFKDVATKYQELRHRVQAIVMSFDSTLAVGSSLRELCVQFVAKTTKK